MRIIRGVRWVGEVVSGGYAWVPGIWAGTAMPPPPPRSPTMEVVKIDRARGTITLRHLLPEGA